MPKAFASPVLFGDKMKNILLAKKIKKKCHSKVFHSKFTPLYEEFQNFELKVWIATGLWFNRVLNTIEAEEWYKRD